MTKKWILSWGSENGVFLKLNAWRLFTENLRAILSVVCLFWHSDPKSPRKIKNESIWASPCHQASTDDEPLHQFFFFSRITLMVWLSKTAGFCSRVLHPQGAPAQGYLRFDQANLHSPDQQGVAEEMLAWRNPKLRVSQQMHGTSVHRMVSVGKTCWRQPCTWLLESSTMATTVVCWSCGNARLAVTRCRVWKRLTTCE